MKNSPLNKLKLATMQPEEIRSMISSVNLLTDQMAMLTAYFERAGAKLHERKAEELGQAVRRILHEQYGAEEDASVELRLAMTAVHEMGAEMFVKKLLWDRDEQHRSLVATLEQVIPHIEQLVEQYPVLMLSQAADSLVAIEMLKLSGVIGSGRPG